METTKCIKNALGTGALTEHKAVQGEEKNEKGETFVLWVCGYPWSKTGGEFRHGVSVWRARPPPVWDKLQRNHWLHKIVGLFLCSHWKQYSFHPDVNCC